MANEPKTDLAPHYTTMLQLASEHIDHHAIQILKKLKDAGFDAFLVGGGVRDLLVNLQPKDFDIATNALPNEVKKKVPFSFIIGRRFKLVHAKRGDQIYEIATFRRAATTEELETTDQDERHLVEENFFGNIEEDSFRRDFTINSLFYDPIDSKIVDHCSGLKDIHASTLRMIGEPKARLIEDPVRILRAIRLSQKLNFTIEPELREKIFELREELKRAVLPRRREEWLKFFRLPQIDLALIELFDLGIFEIILPSFHKLFLDENQRNDFICYIRRFSQAGINTADSTELFSAVLLSYISSTYPKETDIYSLYDDESLLAFCRDELGVFKSEVASFFQAIQFMSPLLRRESYLKKGERRQRSLTSHNSFQLSLKLAFLSSKISGGEFLFWLNEYERLANS